MEKSNPGNKYVHNTSRKSKNDKQAKSNYNKHKRGGSKRIISKKSNAGNKHDYMSTLKD